jgi:hypothetical protein|tara:strand:- start:279 stop:656 length:378 start_codon:yes stop_codon:yes gene_type:complete
MIKKCNREGCDVIYETTWQFNEIQTAYVREPYWGYKNPKEDYTPCRAVGIAEHYFDHNGCNVEITYVSSTSGDRLFPNRFHVPFEVAKKCERIIKKGMPLRVIPLDYLEEIGKCNKDYFNCDESP